MMPISKYEWYVLSFWHSVRDGSELKLRPGNGLSHSISYKTEMQHKKQWVWFKSSEMQELEHSKYIGFALKYKNTNSHVSYALL